MTCVSWNVNGLRAALRKGFLDYVDSESPDVLCLQETKAGPENVPDFHPDGYSLHWNVADKKGYSGTAVLTRETPLEVTRGMGIDQHDHEGRILTLEFRHHYLVNVYVPNTKRDLSRLEYRQAWDRDFLIYLKNLEGKKPVVVCGDMNVAHKEIDLTHPKANVKNHGFTPEERSGFSAMIEAGFIDTFREFCTDGGQYTWWSPMQRARERNVGWRIDYFLISKCIRPALRSAFIRCDVLGSDHCPVGIDLDLL